MQFEPKILILPIHYRCNLNCEMCTIGESSDPQSWKLKELHEIFQHKSFSESLEVVNLTGGEPTIHPEFNSIINLILASCPNLDTLSLQSNGYSVGQFENCLAYCVEHIRDLSVKNRTIHLDVNLSLDGPESVHDSIRGTKGAWRSAIRAALCAQEFLPGLDRSAVHFNCTIVKQNVRHLTETLEIGEKHNIPVIFTLPQTTDVFMNNAENASRFELGESEKQLVLNFLDAYKDRITDSSVMSPRYRSMLQTFLETSKRSLGCPLKKSGVFLDPSGDVYPCWRASNLYAGNVFRRGIEEIFKQRIDEEYLEQVGSFCETCSTNCYVDWERKMALRRLAAKGNQ